jgi:uncharacterized RDD family membrane protein YckC
MDAGWYNDPFGRFAQRYHDGDDWTSHVSHGDGRSFADPSGTDPHVAGTAPSGPATWAPPQATDANGRPFDLASPWIRLAARVLDAIIVAIPAYGLAWTFAGAPVEFNSDFTEYEYNWTSLAIIVAVTALYETFFIGWRGQTPGKIACGIKVVMSGDRSRPDYIVAFVRWAGTSLPGLIPYIGSLIQIASIVLVFADKRRQMIHDKLASTMVVKA